MIIGKLNRVRRDRYVRIPDDIGCLICTGLGVVWKRVVDCQLIPQHSCEHFQHFSYRHCVWCNGNGNAGRISAAIRYLLHLLGGTFA